jgi:putative PIN family toxin of toxin-antitoxin system
LLLPGGSAARAVDRALAHGVALVSDDTLAELADVLSRQRFDRYVTLPQRQRFVQLLLGVARRVPISRRVRACRDPKDDKCLHVALNGDAEAIITGDRDLLVLDPFHGVRNLSPTAFCRDG